MSDSKDLLARFRRPAAAAPLLAPKPNAAARAELVPEYERLPEAPRPLLEVAEELLRQPGGLEAVRAAYVPYVCRASFARFCREAWTPTVEPSTQLVWGWQHELMAATLQALFFDWLRAKMSPPQKKHLNAVINTVFNVCPGSLKSRIVSVFFPAWIWLHDPGFKFICLSVNEEAALRDARAMRTVIRSEWYQETFQPKWSLKGDQDAISNFGNTKGGERLSKASGSEVVGLRGDCVRGFSEVSTEDGPLAIKEIHERLLDGRHVPRVWALDRGTDEMSLCKVLKSRMIPGRTTVDVADVDGTWLQCTGEHKIWEVNHGYRSAHEMAGREVFELSETCRPGIEVCGLQMHTPPPDMSRLWRGDRSSTVFSEVESETGQNRSFLYSSVLERIATESDCEGMQLHCVRKELPPLLETYDTRGMFSELSCSAHESSATDSVRSPMRTLQKDDGSNQFTSEILQQGVFCTIDHRRSSSRDAVFCRDTVGGTIVPDQVKGRRSMSGMWCYDEPFGQGTSCTSSRCESNEQRAGKSGDSLCIVSRNTPLISKRAVLSVNPTSDGNSKDKVDVYDIHVEGLHNFFVRSPGRTQYLNVSNCILMDDPNNPQSSFSKRDRDEVNSLWQHNQSNRVNDVQRSLRIIVQQRVNEHDLTGFVLSRDGVWSPENRYGWLHLVLPAEYDPARKFVLPQELRAVLGELALTGIPLEDPRTVSGESVDPIRMPPSYLESERKRTEGTGFYTSQMLQRPSAAEGAMVKREWFSFFELDAGVRAGIDRLEGGRPRPDGCHAGRAELVGALMHSPGEFNFDETILSIDCAAKETTQGSEWGLLAMARRGGRRYVLDRRTQRGDILTIFKIICELIDEWGVTKVLVEDRAAGPDLRVRMMTEIGEGTLTPVELVMVKVATGKIERTMSALPTMASGMLSLRDGSTWLEPFVDAVCGFPAWPTDDDIDCLTQAINYWADTEENVGGYSLVGCG